jgi:hypothetical protein
MKINMIIYVTVPACGLGRFLDPFEVDSIMQPLFTSLFSLKNKGKYVFYPFLSLSFVTFLREGRPEEGNFCSNEKKNSGLNQVI